MKITRIGKDREIEKETTVIDIEINGRDQAFRLTEVNGELQIHKKDGERISIFPGVANQIYVK